MSNDGMWAEENRELRLENERLRSEIANDVIFKALRERIEELEREFDFWHSVALDYKRDLGEYMRRGRDSLTWEPISHAQIDAAWDYTGDDWDCGRTVAIVLAELGIVRCEECDGSGLATYTDPRSLNEDDPQLDKCPDCNGHRWVKK